VLLRHEFGWNFAGIWYGTRTRDLSEVALRVIGVAASILATCYMWIAMADWRPVLICLPISAAYFVVRLGRKRQGPEYKRPYAVLTDVVGFNAASFCLALVLSSAFPMLTTDAITAVQPGGQYTAVLVNRDGMFSGYDQLALRPKEFSIWTLLDRPERIVAEFDEEDKVTGLQWDSDHQLTVKIVHGSERVWDRPEWHAIKIRYVDDPLYAPDANRQQGPSLLKK